MGLLTKRGRHIGQFIVIIGPTASGKTLLIAELLKRLPKATRLVTTTTRAPRPGEQHGTHYFFVTREEFEKGISDGDFIEHAVVHGNLYGSSRKAIQSFVENFEVVLAALDINGARALKEIDPTVGTLFLRPGSLEELERRLRKERPEASDEEIRTRLETAQRELEVAETFDHVLDNVDGEFESTVAQALAFIEGRNTTRA